MRTELTDKEWVRLREFRMETFEKVTRPGIDEARATAAVCAMYREVGKQPPNIFFIQSPSLDSSLRSSLFSSLYSSLFSSLRSSLYSSLDLSLYSSLFSSLRSSLYSSLRSSLYSSLDSSLDSSLRSSLDSSLRSSLYSSLFSSLDSSLYSSLDSSLDSSLWLWPDWRSDSWPAAWSTFYLFCGTLGLEKPYSADASRRLGVVRELAETCGWIWAHESTAAVSPHPVSHWTDADFETSSPVIHSAVGPAVEFGDGFEIYAWRGTVVPKGWIMDPENEDPRTALTWKDIEQRRAFCEIVGWERVIAQLDTKPIDKDPDPHIGELFSVDLPDAPGTRFLRVLCPTGRTFVLGAPPEAKTALEAQCLINQVEPDVMRALEAQA